MALSPMQKRRRREWLLRATVAWENGMNGASEVALSAYAVGGNEPDVVADFESATEYFRVGGSDTTFASMFDLGTTTAYPTSLRTMVDSDGLLKWGPHNIALQSENFGTTWFPVGTISVTTNTASAPDGNTTADSLSNIPSGSTGFVRQAIAGSYTNAVFACWVRAADSGGATHVRLTTNNQLAWNTGQSTKVAITTSWQKVTVSGNLNSGGANMFLMIGNVTSAGLADADCAGNIHLWGAHLYRSDLGGMVDVPTDQRAASGSAFATYVPTTTAARYLHRRGNYTWNGSSWVKTGILIETEARTNLLLNSGTLSTQNITTSATPYTLSFTGTGTVTLSGTSTAGPLVGTGTGENNRVNLTFTPTAGTLTLTVSGTVTNAQLEAGQTLSSYIPTAGSTVTRAADALTIPAANMSASTSAMSLQLDGTITYADEGAAAQQTFLRWQTDANNYISLDLDTDSTATGEVNANQAVGGTVDTVVAAAQYTAGVNVAFNIASRHTSGAINVAKDGTAATADTTPASLVDLSARNCELFQDAMVNIGQFRQWDVDLGDSGIETAST